MRKVRKRRPHPPGCRHCENVQAYRDMRAAQIEANGGWRNETAHVGCITFKQWLIMCKQNRLALESYDVRLTDTG